jgi:hypothetical protein
VDGTTFWATMFIGNMVWPVDAVGVPTPGMDDFIAGALMSYETLAVVFGSPQSQKYVQPSAADHSEFLMRKLLVLITFSGFTSQL